MKSEFWRGSYNSPSGRTGNQISIGDRCRPAVNEPPSICSAYGMITTTSKGIMEKVSSLIREIENLVIKPTKDALKVRRIDPRGRANVSLL
jgi:hypothetical protein